MGAAGLGTAFGSPVHAAANKHFKGYPESLGVLYDNVLCIGCRNCEAGCNKVNELPQPNQPFDDLTVLMHLRWLTVMIIQKAQKDLYLTRYSVTIALNLHVHQHAL
jgi:Fe-S-cluster-containing dehydrogenase component